jgi:two-component system response regulator LytT
LPSDTFLKCYRCFLINMNYVQRIEGEVFLMKDNREIPISRDKRSQIKNIYLDYLFSKMEDETC